MQCQFALGGCFRGYSIGRDALAGLEARSWRPTQATVLTCEVVPGKGSDAKHQLAIRYEYRWNGKSISSEHFDRKPKTIEIEGVEEARCRRGTSTYTASWVCP